MRKKIFSIFLDCTVSIQIILRNGKSDNIEVTGIEVKDEKRK